MEMAKIKIKQNCVLYLTDDPARGNNIMPGEEREIDLHMPILKGQEHKFEIIIEKPKKAKKKEEPTTEKTEPEIEPENKEPKIDDVQKSGPVRNFRRK